MDTVAAAEAARRKVNRASGLLREATSQLARITDGVEALGVLYVHDSETQEQAAALIELGVQDGGCDVVVIARPRRRNTPTTAPNGAKENGNHASDERSTAAPAEESVTTR